MNQFVIGIWYKKDEHGQQDTELTRPFGSANAAKEHAFWMLQNDPHSYERMLLLECTAVLMNEGSDANPEFRHNGPEYVRGNGNGHDHNQQIGYAAAPAPRPPSIPAPRARDY